MSKIEKRASIVNSSEGRSLESPLEASNQADREEEAINVVGELSTVGVEPRLIGTRRKVTLGGEDLSTLGSDVRESAFSNDNVRNSLDVSKLRIVRILAPEATQNGTQNVTMGKFIFHFFSTNNKLSQIT